MEIIKFIFKNIISILIFLFSLYIILVEGWYRKKDIKDDVLDFLKLLISSKWALISAIAIGFFKLLEYFCGEVTSLYLGKGVSNQRVIQYNKMIFSSEVILLILVTIFLIFLFQVRKK